LIYGGLIWGSLWMVVAGYVSALPAGIVLPMIQAVTLGVGLFAGTPVRVGPPAGIACSVLATFGVLYGQALLFSHVIRRFHRKIKDPHGEL
jgi:hypothetical protein